MRDFLNGSTILRVFIHELGKTDSAGHEDDLLPPVAESQLRVEVIAIAVLQNQDGISSESGNKMT